MKCTHCGQPIADGAQFCGSCGQIITAQSPQQQPQMQQPVSGPPPTPIPPQQPYPNTPPQMVPGVASASPIGPPVGGNMVNPVYGSPPQVPGPSNPYAGQVSDRSYLTTFLLAYFLGFVGADRFYTKETGLAILKLLTLGGCGVWSFVDTVLILAGVRKDKLGRELYNRKKDYKLSLIIFIIFFALSSIGSFISYFAPNNY